MYTVCLLLVQVAGVGAGERVGLVGGRVLVELPSVELGHGEVVLAAALTLVPDDVAVVCVLPGVDEVTGAHLEVVSQLCARLGGPDVREVEVWGSFPGGDDAGLRVVAAPDARAAAEAVDALVRAHRGL